MSTKPCSITQGVPWNHSSSKICAEESPPVRWLIENSPRMWEGFHERGQVLTRDKRVYTRNGVRFDLDGKLSQWQRGRTMLANSS